MTNNKKLIFGAGSWGYAMACHIGKKHKDTVLYARDYHQANDINRTQTNQKYNIHEKITSNVLVTSNLKKAVENAEEIYLIIPSVAFETSLKKIKEHIRPNTPIIWG